MTTNDSYTKIIDYDKFYTLMGNERFDFIANENNLDLSIDKFIDILTTNLRLCTSVTKNQGKFKKRKDWITSGIIRSILTRDDLYKKYRSDSTPERKSVLEMY